MYRYRIKLYSPYVADWYNETGEYMFIPWALLKTGWLHLKSINKHHEVLSQHCNGTVDLLLSQVRHDFSHIDIKKIHRVSIILLGTNFSEILIEIQNFSFTKNAAENIVWEMGAILSRWRWANITCLSPPGLRVNIKTVLPGYRNSHIKDKTVLRPSYLYNGNFYADKTAFIHWDGSRGPNLMRVNFPAWISNYIHYKVLVVINNTFSNFIKLKFLNG